MWDLPTTVEVNGKTYEINTDYRDILTILSLYNRNDLSEMGKSLAAIQIFYKDKIPTDTQIAAKKMFEFINLNEEQSEEDAKPLMPVYDWEQDYLAIVADVNRVAGCEIRALPYLHWFTFMSYFHAIGEGQLSFLICLRTKLRKGQKLEDSEREYYAQNRSKVNLKAHLSYEDEKEMERINDIFK